MNSPSHAVSRLSPSTLALVVLAHMGVLAGLIYTHVVPVALPSSALMVDVIWSRSTEQARTQTAPPQPKTVVQTSRPLPPVKTPVLATDGPQAALPRETSKIEPPSLPPAPASTQAATPSAQAAPTPSAPRFDADYLDNPAPNYPPLSKRAGEEGKVMLRVYVEPSGLPRKVEVRTSSGFDRLDQSAVAAVTRWKFVPAKQSGQAVGAWVLVPIVFSLKF